MNNDPTIPDTLKRLAALLGTALKHRKLEIPAQFGKGFCVGYIFNEHIRMLISNYELHEDIKLKNPDINPGKRMLFFKFKNIFPRAKASSKGQPSMESPSVLIATSRINTDDIISIHTNTATINVEVDAEYLKGLIDPPGKSPVLQSLLENTQPLLFEQLVSASLQKVADEIVSAPVDEAFELFFMRIKAEELICRLLMALEKRDEKLLYALNIADITTIYKVKEQMLGHLDEPPVIGELALSAGMSPTKLKRLFKQIFGNSLFSYYQECRMREAAFLLKEKKLSVSEVGYKLGFTNLSHFSRVFKEHAGMNPKQYALI